jgi:hypothetical protein
MGFQSKTGVEKATGDVTFVKLRLVLQLKLLSVYFYNGKIRKKLARNFK